MAETLGDRLKRLRKERDLGLRETASKVGISATFLSRVENNAEKAAPSEEVIRKLANVLGEEFDTLMQLAGRVAHDVADVIKADAGMPAFLRRAREENLSAEDLMKLLDKSKKGKP
jgi:HTH-type transcriptional regulator, competence development regulator